MMEWYEAFSDYNYQMKQFEELVSAVVNNVTGSMKIVYQGTALDFTPPWKRMTMIEAIREVGKIDSDKMTDAELIAECKKADAKFEVPAPCTRGLLIAFLFEVLCEKKFVQPTFVMDYPIEISPLTKKKRGNPMLVERFEPYVNGVEIGNAYSELSDPVEQYERLKAQRAYDADSIKRDGVAHHPVDTDFVEAMGLGMPPTGGVGLGIDRLIMFITNQSSIRDIIPFPMMRQLGGTTDEAGKA
jgi:lysyl-tRNA synthetase class 2